MVNVIDDLDIIHKMLAIVILKKRIEPRSDGKGVNKGRA